MAEEKKKDRGKWFREMKSELKKVVWPDGKTTAKNTGTVILCSLGVGVFIWVFDAVAVLAVKTLVGLFNFSPDPQHAHLNACNGILNAMDADLQPYESQLIHL